MHRLVNNGQLVPPEYLSSGETDAEMVIEPFLDSEDHIETIPEVDVLQR